MVGSVLVVWVLTVRFCLIVWIYCGWLFVTSGWFQCMGFVASVQVVWMFFDVGRVDCVLLFIVRLVAFRIFGLIVILVRLEILFVVDVLKFLCFCFMLLR